MHEMVEELYDLCETLEKDLAKTNEKLRMGGGELSGADLEYVDKLTHSLKSIKTTIAMMEADDGYSNHYWPMSYAGDGGTQAGTTSNRSSYRGDSYRGSYARGRRRDSMGRYSRADDFRGMLEEAMENAPNDQTKDQLRRMIQQM